MSSFIITPYNIMVSLLQFIILVFRDKLIEFSCDFAVYFGYFLPGKNGKRNKNKELSDAFAMVVIIPDSSELSIS